MSLEQIRIALRGAIAQSPFAGTKRKAKLDYCDRQITLYKRQYSACGLTIIYAQVRKWEEVRRLVNLEKL